MTMNLKIMIIALFVCVIQIKAQQRIESIPASYPKNTDKMEVVDSATLRVFYAFNATNIKDPKTYDDYQCLEIGKSLYKYYSVFVFQSDSAVTAWKKKNKGAKSSPNSIGELGKTSWIEYKYSEYFTDMTKNTITEYTRMPFGMHRFNSFCEDTIQRQNWQLEENRQVIAGLICQKAICRFRGRNYTAWFTAQIPLSTGPWKFGGLPGLILKVQSNDDEYSFECVGIVFLKHKQPIKKYLSYNKLPRIERLKLLKLQKATREDWIKTGGGIRTSGVRQKIVYSPIELE